MCSWQLCAAGKLPNDLGGAEVAAVGGADSGPDKDFCQGGAATKVLLLQILYNRANYRDYSRLEYP